MKENGNQGVGDFRFINILQLFSVTLLYHFFSILFFTHHICLHPRPTTSTHYPRHLTTLVPRLIHHPKTLHLVLTFQFAGWLFKFMKSLQKNFHIVLDVFHHFAKWNLKGLTPTFSRNKTVESHWKFCQKYFKIFHWLLWFNPTRCKWLKVLVF